jgi:hypothetical protein
VKRIFTIRGKRIGIGPTVQKQFSHDNMAHSGGFMQWSPLIGIAVIDLMDISKIVSG